MARQNLVPRAFRDHNLTQMRGSYQESDGKGDRISSLPECLLSNILSRLPTKDVVRTCVLSKKWEYKWTCIYNLDFNDRYFYTSRRTNRYFFSYFVDRVLMHGSSSLQSFILHCSFCYDSSQIQLWISAALQRSVQILEIDIWSSSLVLPRCIYDCDSLKELRLLSQVTIRVPSDTLFSKLTKIEFNHVTLTNQDFGSNEHLLLKFPILESLSMYNCKWRSVKAVKLEAPLLTSFEMTYDNDPYGDRMDDFVFEICGSNLVDFKLNGELSECYVLPKPSLMETASVKLFFSGEWSPNGLQIANTLRQMNALKYLELSGDVLNALNQVGQMSSLPLFGNLIHLKLYTTYYSLTNGAAIIRLIQQAPMLQMLTINMCSSVRNGLQYDGSQEVGIPTCFSSHFKTAVFAYVYDILKKEEDLDLMKFILKKAEVLEQMQIITPKNINTPIPSPEVRELLLSFPRGSSVAQVVFS